MAIKIWLSEVPVKNKKLKITRIEIIFNKIKDIVSSKYSDSFIVYTQFPKQFL